MSQNDHRTTGSSSMLNVVEVHAHGPQIIVWYGRNRKQAERVCERLNGERERVSFYYEIQEAR